MKSRYCSLLLLLSMMFVFLPSVHAQMEDPVRWTVKTVEDVSARRVTLEMTASIDAGWHMYSNLIDPSVGPTPLTVDIKEMQGLKPVGELTASKSAVKKFDDVFGAELSWWTGRVTLKRTFDVTADKYKLAGAIRFQACNDRNCLPPTKEQFSFNGTMASMPPEDKSAVSQPLDTVTDSVVSDSIAADSVASGGSMVQSDNSSLWAPVSFGDGNDADSYRASSLLWIFITCFIGGFIALLTPCVWPMIPLTVSFFLKKGKSRSRAVGDALTYGLSIIVIYVLLGMVVTLVFGADSLNALSTSAICNIIFFLLLVVFAISFFGAFDITLPSKMVNKIDARAEKSTGLLAMFFMAFTLTLVSFSCTGPIIGTLLVEAATQGDTFGPMVGMFGFSLALAIPFALFAMFPSWLQSAPKSGGWMGTVKVVLGFIELALSLKFLSVADLAYGWHILDREVFLCLWIGIFALLGAYLMGWFSFKHYGSADSSIGLVRFFLALASFSLTIYLVPGLWGAPLKGVSAFVPPLYTQDFNLYGAGFKEYHDYDEGMAAAALEGKPVFVDFSGYGCVNCRKMEGAVLDQPDVKTMIDDNFVVIKLMVDEKKDLPQPRKVMERGRELTLETYGELWSYLQRSKFGANAQPYYVVLDPQGRLLSGPFSYDEDVPKFVRFLETGMANFKK